jgi:hypothetical protein
MISLALPYKKINSALCGIGLSWFSASNRITPPIRIYIQNRFSPSIRGPMCTWCTEDRKSLETVPLMVHMHQPSEEFGCRCWHLVRYSRYQQWPKCTSNQWCENSPCRGCQLIYSTVMGGYIFDEKIILKECTPETYSFLCKKYRK